jgi:hypothetical protein
MHHFHVFAEPSLVTEIFFTLLTWKLCLVDLVTFPMIIG